MLKPWQLMRDWPAVAVVNGFLLGVGSALALAVALPRERAGWFELDGEPVRLNGQDVADWRHVNDILAKPAPEFVDMLFEYRELHTVANAARWVPPPPEVLERTFRIEYRPSAASSELRTVTVQRYMPTLLIGGGRMHPSAYAWHVLVDSDGAK